MRLTIKTGDINMKQVMSVINIMRKDLNMRLTKFI